MHESLRSSHGRLDRAEHHLAELARAVQEWIASEPWRVASRKLYPAWTESWFFDVDPVPIPIDCIVADALHNIRAPLDKMLTAYMAATFGGGPGTRYPGIGFPARASHQEYSEAMRGLRRKNLPAAALAFLDDLQPYRGGTDSWLFDLHSLDVENKHYPSVLPITAGSVTTNIGEVRVNGGRLLILGSPRGRHMVAKDPVGPGPNDIVQPVESLKPTYREREGRGYLEFTSPATDFEFMTTTLGATFTGRVAPDLDVALAASDGSSVGPVTSAIGEFLSRTRALVQSFEKAAFAG